RLRDVPHYLGMDRHRFNNEVRPYLIEIPIGIQGIAFDKLDLDAWVDQYKQSNGRPAQNKRYKLWGAKECQDLPYGAVSGRSTKKLTDDAFMKVLERAISKK